MQYNMHYMMYHALQENRVGQGLKIILLTNCTLLLDLVVPNDNFVLLRTGLLILRVAAELRNPGKSAKSRKIHKNTQNTAKFGSVEILSNTCLYSNFETCLSYWGYLLAVNSQNSSQNFLTETCKQRSKTTRCRLCCEKLGTSHDVKGFAIGSFLERIVVE